MDETIVQQGAQLSYFADTTTVPNISLHHISLIFCSHLTHLAQITIVLRIHLAHISLTASTLRAVLPRAAHAAVGGTPGDG